MNSRKKYNMDLQNEIDERETRDDDIYLAGMKDLIEYGRLMCPSVLIETFGERLGEHFARKLECEKKGDRMKLLVEIDNIEPIAAYMKKYRENLRIKRLADDAGLQTAEVAKQKYDETKAKGAKQ